MFIYIVQDQDICLIFHNGHFSCVLCIKFQLIIHMGASYMYYIVVSWVAMRKILYDIDIFIQYFNNLKYFWDAHAFTFFFICSGQVLSHNIYLFRNRGGSILFSKTCLVFLFISAYNCHLITCIILFFLIAPLLLQKCIFTFTGTLHR